MDDSYNHLSIEKLQEVLKSYESNLHEISLQIAKSGIKVPISLHNERDFTINNIRNIKEILLSRSDDGNVNIPIGRVDSPHTKLNQSAHENSRNVTIPIHSISDKKTKKYTINVIMLAFLIVCFSIVIVIYSKTISASDSSTPTVSVTSVINTPDLLSQIPTAAASATVEQSIIEEFYRVKLQPSTALYTDPNLGKVQQYTHNIVGKIRYDRVSVDDDIAKVEVICPSITTDVTSKFSKTTSHSADIFPNYESQLIDVSEDCVVVFTIADKVGNSTGLTVYGNATKSSR